MERSLLRSCYLLCVLVIAGIVVVGAPAQPPPNLDGQLATVLKGNGFTGKVGMQIAQRLGRPINANLANAGRLLFFDSILGVNKDNSCAGCHSPLRGFSDSQAIAIGVGNNGVVGPGRTGPRNKRRAPTVLNAAFYPNLMWDSRFVSLSGNPFNNQAGFKFPAPELGGLSYLPNLLTAQAFIPVTEQNEMAGFQFVGTHDQIRAEVVKRVNLVPAYPAMFGGPVTYDTIALALAEFQFSLVRANAPIDQFARGNPAAMTVNQKRGALLFFGKAACVKCHQVAGAANEMFSDFKPRNSAIPQLVPKLTNTAFDGPNNNEDFGFEKVTGNLADRYKFRTTPLRNVALQPAFFHDGAFNKLEDAINYHLNAKGLAAAYTPVGRVPLDLAGPIAPLAPIVARIDPLSAQPVILTPQEFGWLVEFVRFGLLDPAATPNQLKALIPANVPSGMPVPVFQ